MSVEFKIFQSMILMVLLMLYYFIPLVHAVVARLLLLLQNYFSLQTEPHNLILIVEFKFGIVGSLIGLKKMQYKNRLEAASVTKRERERYGI